MPKRIEVTLTETEEEVLKEYVSQGVKNARGINRARVLLLSNEGVNPKKVQEILGLSRSTICNVKNRYIEKGEQSILDCIKDKDRSGRPVKLDSTVKAKTSLIACSAPPEGRVRWTLELIADKLVKLEAVESVSHESVRQMLKKTNSSPG